MSFYILFQTRDIILKACIGDYENIILDIKTKNYWGRGEFCIPTQNILEHIQSLTLIINSLNGNYKISDMDSDAHLSFDMKLYGKLTVSGQIGGTHTNNCLIFEFEADQTLLQNIVLFLKRVINYRDRGDS